MNRIIMVNDLNDNQLDILWSDSCPLCGGYISDSNKTVDDAWWICKHCKIEFVCE